MAGDPDTLLRRIRVLFVAELEEAVRALNDGLLVLGDRAEAERRPELVRELFRVAHGIKGAAHSASVPEAVAAASRLEDTFSELRDRPLPEWDLDVDALLQEVDVLAGIHAALAGAAVDVAPSALGGSSTAAPPQEPAVTAVRVDAERLERVVATAREVQLLTSEIGDLVHGVSDTAGSADDQRRAARRASSLVGQLARLSSDVGAAALELTLQPFGDACDGLARALHDVAAAGGKQARLSIGGAEIRIDRAVVAALREPLLHLVRNAGDHGIETPDRRRLAGKPDEGSVRIDATIAGGLLEVSVSDDGAGVDRGALAAAAERSGVQVDAQDDSLAFLPGISTAGAVTAVSGRGVGLDAVRSRIEAIGGSVRLDSAPGAGTTVTIRSPLTLAVMEVLLVEAAGVHLGVPAASVARVVEVAPQELDQVGPRLVLRQRPDAVSVVAVATLAGLDDPGPPSADRWTLVLVNAGERQVAARVDGVAGISQIVMQPLPPRAAGTDLLLGAAVVAEGVPAIVINPAACARRATTIEMPARSGPGDGPGQTRVIVAEDTLTTRTLEVGILEAAGYHVLAAADGQEAWELLERHGADVVVSDVDMPRLDGIELCRRIRASSRFSSLPVVLVTSLDSPDDRRRGVEAGADAYLVKTTFDQGTLLDAVARVR